MRKHINQMLSVEVQAITSRVQYLSAQRAFCDHSNGRMKNKNVSAREIETTLRYGQPVEVHAESGDLRAVITLCFGKPKVRVQVVLSLENGTVISTWKNDATDRHATLDKSLYGWQANVVEMLAAL